MKDFDKLKKELIESSKKIKVKNILKKYELPNFEQIHNMIYGYQLLTLDQDYTFFEKAESIDYFNYEKELWKLNKLK